MKSFTKKAVELQLVLGKGDFGGAGNTKIIRGLACDVTVRKPGLPEKNSATVSVYGLSLVDMEQLTKLSFRPLESQRNTMAIRAGEEDGAMSLIFSGEVTRANAVFGNNADVAFEIEAISGFYVQQKAAAPVSYKGKTPYADILLQIAGAAGLVLKNEGISGSGTNVILNGDNIKKLQDLAKQAGADLRIDDGVAIVSPKAQPLSGPAVLLSAESGMIGYPGFTQQGIAVKTLFNGNLRHGGLVRVQSIVPKASGQWMITNLTHTLSAYKSGPWESSVEAVSA